MKKLLKKKNNKGFSLVELIVVVLIMAIIAVALSPQVLKWVDKSRTSADCDNYNAMVELCQLAMTYSNAYNEVKGLNEEGKYEITISTSGLTVELGGATIAATDYGQHAFTAALTALDAEWSKITAKRAEATGANAYKIYVYGGNVIKFKAPQNDVTAETVATS